MSQALEHPLATLLLDIPSRLYGVLIGWRNRLYDRPSRIHRTSVPVVSIGNLTVGGTGKTPMVEWVCRTLQEMGETPAVVSRGYGGHAGKGPLVVSAGQGPLVSCDLSGDEPNLLARSLSGVPIVIGSDRVAGAGEAVEQGATVVVLDDGFQHRRLHRDLDVVLLDASNPFGNYRMLPAGRLREPIPGLKRADVVVLTRARPEERFAVIEKVIRIHNTHALILHAGHRGLGFFQAGERVEKPGRVVAFCAIGNPSRFRIELEAQGIEIAEFRTFRDHHRFRPEELAELQAHSRDLQAPLLTTEKDLARIPDPSAAIVYRIATEIFDAQPMHDALAKLVETDR